MTPGSLHEQVSRPMSSRIRRLHRAAAEARAEAELAVEKTIRRAPPESGALVRSARWAASRVVHSVASTVARHPVSTLLIAGVLAGTVWYHRTPGSSRDS